MTIIFGPVGGIGQGRSRPDNGANLLGQSAKSLDGRIGAARAAHLGHTAQFRTNQERIHTPGLLDQIGIVKHHPAQTPIPSARTEKTLNLRCGRRRPIHRTAKTGRWMTGDPPAPRIGPLLHPAIGIGQARIGRDIH